MLVIIGHQNVVGDRIEPWYNVSFSVAPIDPARLSRWKNALAMGFNSNGVSSQIPLKLPEKNEYLPDKRLLNELPPTSNITDRPQLVMNETGVRVWCMNSHPFESPKFDFDILLWNPNLQGTSRDTVLGNLGTKLFYEELERNLAAAADAGNSFLISVDVFHSTLSVGGYDPATIERIIRDILKKFKNKDIYRDPRTLA